MRYSFCIAALFAVLLLANKPGSAQSAPSPLAAYSSEWNNARFNKCNTASDANYLSDAEKQVICILNLVRTDPKLFANTVLKKYVEETGQGFISNSDEYKSLMDTLKKLKPLNLLYPDSISFVSAQCHALYSGATAYVGHDRKSDECKKKMHFSGECCDYGHKEPLAILVSLLIDQYVPSLGHRYICLSTYKKIGVSIQRHNQYGNNAVLDFSY